MARPPLAPIVEWDEIAGGRPEVVVCDVRWYLDGRSGHEAYLAGHVPGSIWVDLTEHLSAGGSPELGRHPLPSAEAFAASLGSLGIGPGDPVVAYDDQNGLSAGRLVWMLRVLGHDAALANGGLGAWSGELETEPSVRAPVACPVRPWPLDAFAEIDDAAAAGLDPGSVLIDARAGDRYRGEVEPVDPRAGHIPGAINVPATDNLDSQGRFLGADALRALYEASGVTAPASSADAPANQTAVRDSAGGTSGQATVYCGSGVSACMDALAIERAGLGRPKLYVGSWSQWSHTPRPAATT